MVIAKQKIFQISVYAFAFSLLSSIYQNGALADSKTYSADPLKRLEVIISDKGVNRITIEKDRILKIIGNEGDYMIDGDSNKGFVFLNSKVEKGESFPVTIISEKGLVQDVKFSVKGDIDSSTVTIKSVGKGSKNGSVKSQSRLLDSSLEQRVIVMVSDVFKGKTSQYRIRKIKWKKNKLLPIEGEQVSEYISEKMGLKVTRFNFLVKHHIDTKMIMKAVANVVAVSERGNNLLIVSKL